MVSYENIWTFTMSDYPKLRGTTQNYKKKYPLFFLGKLYKIGIVLDIGFHEFIERYKIDSWTKSVKMIWKVKA